MMSDEEREEKELDLTSPEVVTKYKTAADIVNSNSLSPLPYLSLFFVLCFLMFVLMYVMRK